jgi:hypothetical protein
MLVTARNRVEPGVHLRHNIERLRIRMGSSWLRLQKGADRDPHCETADAQPENRETHHEKIEASLLIGSFPCA